MEKTDKIFKILLCVTGSVAAIKTREIIELIKNCMPNSEVKVIITQNSKHFLPNKRHLIEVGAESVLSCADEWSAWQGRGDPVLHIELRNWADIALIAPLDANTLAKISNGICDNLLTCILRAWEIGENAKPVLFAPAMNTGMWNHPITSEQIYILNKWGFTEIPVVEKLLMCNQRGLGAMAEPVYIVKTVFDVLSNRYPM
ncbi:phosphopantothenoylcysteine decarboxylase [Lepeophtheirus salmonis]|uniref:Phosphopantothenoylcysteine decarboxylase n=1 Tax=Lepeophtheirus salmonis TaxID=72036 RepID=C1BU11_LEPSM|nr:phosphopantothenoylcysteine decarboxylase-like [Lepeophtheirus salmonis]ACO12514.1 Phosphopantothenoylcysteine decarboxylase [Lepeophtheirus salmonis]